MSHPYIGQVLSPDWPDGVDESFFRVMLPTADGIDTNEVVRGRSMYDVQLMDA